MSDYLSRLPSGAELGPLTAPLPAPAPDPDADPQFERLIMSERLARTWNANGSGTLWVREWRRHDEQYFSVLESGLLPADEYPDAEQFWAAYEQEAKRFAGSREVARTDHRLASSD